MFEVAIEVFMFVMFFCVGWIVGVCIYDFFVMKRRDR